MAQNLYNHVVPKQCEIEIQAFSEPTRKISADVMNITSKFEYIITIRNEVDDKFGSGYYIRNVFNQLMTSQFYPPYKRHLTPF